MIFNLGVSNLIVTISSLSAIIFIQTDFKIQFRTIVSNIRGGILENVIEVLGLGLDAQVIGLDVLVIILSSARGQLQYFLISYKENNQTRDKI